MLLRKKSTHQKISHLLSFDLIFVYFSIILHLSKLNMSEEIIRVNMVLFNFKSVVKPSWIKLHAWLKSTGVKVGDADVVAFDDFLRLAIVKFDNSDLFDGYVARHPTGVVEYSNDEGKFQIRF